MSKRITFMASVGLTALGIAAISVAQGSLLPTQKASAENARISPAQTDPYARYYGKAAPRDYTQLAQTTDPSLASGPLGTAPPAGTAPQAGTYQSPPVPTYAPAPTYTAPMPSSGGTYYPSAPQNFPQNSMAGGPLTNGPLGSSMPSGTAPQSGGTYYPPQMPVQASGHVAPTYQVPTYQTPNYQGPAYQGAAPQAPNYETYAAGGPNSQSVPQNRSWWQKLGFGTLELVTDGYLKLGDAAVWRGSDDADTGDVQSALGIDGMIRSELSAVTSGGYEYGATLQLRGQRDRYKRGFGGSTNIFDIGDCPPGVAGCNSLVVDSTPRAIRGYTGRLYNFGENEQKEHVAAIESAHLFLRGPYGDITLGLDDGAAALFSLDTPSTLPMARGSNLRTDYTGLDMTKTVNDASGFAPKVTYVSPRLLGDQIGVGVQIGGSFTPNTEACGVDYCVRGNDYANTFAPIAPEMENAVELGIALDRTFNNGFGVELAASYAAATESTGYDVFEDLQAYNVGLNMRYDAFEFGANYLSSNNGWAAEGDYQAADLGLTWQPNAWGVTAGLGWSQDDLARATGKSALLGVSYDFDWMTLGAGVQYADREVPVYNGTDVSLITQDGTSLFLEGAVKF